MAKLKLQKKNGKTKNVKEKKKPITKPVIRFKARLISKPTPKLSRRPSTKPQASASIRSKYKDEIEALMHETERLKAENLAAMEKYGKLLEVNTSLYLKSDVMLGQIIKALYIMGITPDMIVRKCSEMFQKVEPGKPESGGR